MNTFIALTLCALLSQEDGSKSQARDLIEKLRSNKLEERENATRKLKELGQAAIPELEKATKDADLDVRGRVTGILAEIRLVNELVTKAKNKFVANAIQAEKEGARRTERRTFSDFGCGITDIGDVRIVVRDLTFPGESSNDIIIKSTLANGDSGETGDGNRRFTYSHKDGVTTCTWAGFEFRIKDSTLTLSDKAVRIGEGKTIVILSRSGEVQRVTRIEEVKKEKD